MAIALPIAPTVDCPLTFAGEKLAVLMKNSPNVDIRTRGMNLMIVVQSWTAPMFLTPERLTAAGSHRPTRAMTIDHPVRWLLFTNSST